jgi:hypothetical protein
MTPLLAIILLWLAILAAGVLIIYTLAAITRRVRRRRHRNRLRTLSDREVADALAPFGADISVWPSCAPRNGATYDPIE